MNFKGIFVSLGVLLSCNLFRAQALSQPPQINTESKESLSLKAENRFLGLIFKITAKGVLFSYDVDKLKVESINKINKMSQEAFGARYLDFYEHIVEFRQFCKQFGLTEFMSKESAIALIRTMDKQKINEMIDAFPDELIAREFKRYVFKNKKTAPNLNDAGELWEMFGRMIQGLKKKYL